MANEKRLIDANAVLRRMNKRREDFADGWKTFDAMPDGGKCKYEENLKCALMIEDAPTVDAVEVEKYIELREQYDKLFLEYHELRDNFISYVCSGIPNPSPFCLNKRRGCCDSRGWCKNDDKCQGFNPAEVILDGAKMDGDGNG